MSKNTISIISGSTTYYLSGGGASQVIYAGTGSSWTSESTTPYKLSMNDVTGNIWTPQTPPVQTVWRGGGQFGMGRKPYSKSYGNIVETVGIQFRATTKNNAVILLRQLETILNSGEAGEFAQLGVQGGTNTAYANIYQADITLLPNYLWEPTGTSQSATTLFRGSITWERSLFGVRDNNVEAAISVTPFTNTGTGGSDNVVAFSASLSGDLADHGQPLNVAMGPPSANAGPPYYLASVYQRVYTNTSQSVVTSSTSGATATGVATHDMTTYFRRNGIMPRVLARITSPNALLEMRLTVTDFGNSTAVYESPWIPFSTNTVLVDFGSFSPEPWRLMAADGYSVAASLNFSYRSTSGGATTGTIDYVEVLDAYTFATIDGPSFTTSQWLRAITFPDNRNSLVCLPYDSTFATVVSTYGDLGNLARVRGELPKYFPGASLYVAWHDSSGAHTTTRTCDVFVTHAPLWKHLRGSD